jgi:trk system potassium uptake protein TrkA
MYQKEVENREMTTNLASSITTTKIKPHIRFMEGYSIAEIEPPKSFIGKSIKELDIRKKYGVDILSIKTNDRQDVKAIPEATHIFSEGEILIVAGEVGNINVLKNLN